MTSILCARRSSRSSISKVWTSIPELTSGQTIWTIPPVYGSDYLPTAQHTHKSNCCTHLDLSLRETVCVRGLPV
ncbi:hypothetical protein OIDMADRAFT_21429 [Oidiodendron maius Zn]|uniref:Uncharacterized protein n=1 Tax=Oidiodendron maius (strain Zn) TaxID=913774 RepID=A0A0C3GSZ6_OIDMZ|nr:hypothetical protein OIDMADRAFT_21429 [Oidiodendron maius Zn]